MKPLTSKYEFDQLVEYDPPTTQESGYAYGFIKAIKFRKTDAVNHIVEYTIYQCNTEKIDEDVRESEIKKVIG